MNILFYETFCKSKKAIASLKPGTSTGRVAFHKNIVQVESSAGRIGYAPLLC